MSATETAAGIAPDLERERRLLWGLAYRMTGVAADADEIVQETLARALETPPASDRPVRPWLVRVAANLARDRLRARRRRPYTGPWLPAPVETDDAPEPEGAEPSPDERYGVAESATFAFLLAAEALTPRERAALVLRDVLDLSAREAAEALGASEGAVRVAHLRARRAMARAPRARFRTTAVARRRAREALERFLAAVGAGDVDGVARLLGEDARATTDAGGEFLAARNVVTGRDRVARLFVGLGRGLPARATFEWRTVNGMPAVWIETSAPAVSVGPAKLTAASRFLVRVELDDDGRIADVQAVVASRKLTAMRGA